MISNKVNLILGFFRFLVLALFLLIIIAETNYLSNKNVFFEKIPFLKICLASVSLFLVLKFFPTASKVKMVRTLLLIIKSLLVVTVLYLILVEASMMDFSGKQFGVEFFYHLEWKSFVLGVKEYLFEFILFVVFVLIASWAVLYQSPSTNLAKQLVYFIPSVLALICFFNTTVLGRFYQGYSQYQESINLPLVAAKELKKYEKFGISSSTITKSEIKAEIGNGKNVITIYLESFSQVFTESDRYPGLTPNLNKLIESHTQLKSYYSTANVTMDGLISSNCGFIPNLAHGNNTMTGSKKMYTQLPCATDVLKQAGYYQEFIGGASKLFSGKSDFLLDHGFDKVWGWEDFAEMDQFGKDYKKSWWGLHDEDLFDFAIERIKKANQRGKPYNFNILTLSTHLKGFSSPSCNKYLENSDRYIDSIHCLDQLIGAFIDKLESEKLLKNTILIATADHNVFNTSLTQKLFGKNFANSEIFGVIVDGQKKDIETPMALYDLGATILGLLDIDHNAEFILGKNILGDSLERILFNRELYFSNDQWQAPERECKKKTSETIEKPFDRCEFSKLFNNLYGYSSSFSLDRGIKVNSESVLEIKFDNEINKIISIKLNDKDIIAEFRRYGFVLEPIYLSRDGILILFFDPSNHNLHSLLNMPLEESSQLNLMRIIKSLPNDSFVIFSNKRENNLQKVKALSEELNLKCIVENVCVNNLNKSLMPSYSPKSKILEIRFN